MDELVWLAKRLGELGAAEYHRRLGEAIDLAFPPGDFVWEKGKRGMLRKSELVLTTWESFVMRARLLVDRADELRRIVAEMAYELRGDQVLALLEIAAELEILGKAAEACRDDTRQVLDGGAYSEDRV